MGVFESQKRIDIVMELCEGGSLGQLLAKRKRLVERSAAGAMSVALSVIAHAHSMNVLYR
jgi:serine/threonine protein kinase